MTKHRVTRRPLIGDYSSVESRNHYSLSRIAGPAGSKSNSIAARGAQACRSMINGLAIRGDGRAVKEEGPTRRRARRARPHRPGRGPAILGRSCKDEVGDDTTTIAKQLTLEIHHMLRGRDCRNSNGIWTRSRLFGLRDMLRGVRYCRSPTLSTGTQHRRCLSSPPATPTPNTYIHPSLKSKM